MPLGLGNNLSRAGIVAPGIITSSLVLKHNYAAGGVHPLSDGAAFFDGADDKITITDTATLSPSSITAAAWVKFPGEAPTDDYPRIIDNGGASKGWHLRFTKSDNIFRARVSNDGTAQELIASDTAYTDYTKWYHVAFTYNHSDGEGKIYIDGVHDGTDTLSGGGTLNDPTGNILIGEAGAGGQNWDGYICNVGVWSAVLTQAQIKSIMNKNYAGLTSSETTSLVSWWNLDAETNTSGESGTGGVKDHHGSNHGTLA